MNEEFITYQKSESKSSILKLAKLIEGFKVEYLVEDHSATFDLTMANNEIQKEYRLKLKKIDFEKVDRIVEKNSELNLNDIQDDYYLFSFTNEELLEIIIKRDEWNNFDFQLSQKILKDRGVEVTVEMLALLRKQRITELAKPEEHQRVWIIAGYICAFLGGFLAIFIGWHLSTHKKTLPNGNKFYAYNVSDRKQGKRIKFIGIVFLLIWTLIRILQQLH